MLTIHWTWAQLASVKATNNHVRLVRHEKKSRPKDAIRMSLASSPAAGREEAFLSSEVNAIHVSRVCGLTRFGWYCSRSPNSRKIKFMPSSSGLVRPSPKRSRNCLSCWTKWPLMDNRTVLFAYSHCHVTSVLSLIGLHFLTKKLQWLQAKVLEKTPYQSDGHPHSPEAQCESAAHQIQLSCHAGVHARSKHRMPAFLQPLPQQRSAGFSNPSVPKSEDETYKVGSLEYHNDEPIKHLRCIHDIRSVAH